MRIRFRFSKLGKIRFTSQRDVARMWERALRRAGLPLAYTAGFSPRPQLSFGLALPTGCESLAEYLDVALDEGRPGAAPSRCPRSPACSRPCCPRGSRWRRPSWSAPEGLAAAGGHLVLVDDAHRRDPARRARGPGRGPPRRTRGPHRARAQGARGARRPPAVGAAPWPWPTPMQTWSRIPPDAPSGFGPSWPPNPAGCARWN